MNLQEAREAVWPLGCRVAFAVNGSRKPNQPRRVVDHLVHVHDIVVEPVAEFEAPTDDAPSSEGKSSVNRCARFQSHEVGPAILSTSS